MLGKIRFFVRTTDGLPKPGVHVQLTSTLLALPREKIPSSELAMHDVTNAYFGLDDMASAAFEWAVKVGAIDATPGGTENPLQELLKGLIASAAIQFGLGQRTVLATALTDMNGYAVIELGSLPQPALDQLDIAIRLAIFGLPSELQLREQDDDSDGTSLLETAKRSLLGNVEDVAEAVAGLYQTMFGGCNARIVAANAHGAPCLLERAYGKVEQPDACDYRLSPSSFVARPNGVIGDNGCEHLIPGSHPVRTALLGRVVVHTRVGGDATFTTELPSLAQDPQPFREVQWGEYLEFEQTWHALGHSLGEIKYSLPLAPGEAVRLAVVDFSRTDDISRDDKVGLAERLRHRQSRDRDIDNIVTGTLDESQSGNSSMAGGAIDVEYKPRDDLSIGGTFGGATGVSYSQGGRDLAASELQSIHDVILQRSSAYRSLTSSVVIQATQDETSSIGTRIVANMNRGHTLTISYYEVLRHLLVRTVFKSRRAMILVPVQLLEFTNDLLRRYRSILIQNLLDSRYAADFDAVERLVAGDAIYAPAPIDTVGGGKEIEQPDTTQVTTSCSEFDLTIVSGKHGASDEADTWGDVTVELVLRTGSKVSLFHKPAGSASSFTGLGSTWTKPAQGPRREFTARRSIPTTVILDEVVGIEVSYKSFNAADAWNVVSVEVQAVPASGKALLGRNDFTTVLLAKAENLEPVWQTLPRIPVNWATPQPVVTETDDETEEPISPIPQAPASQPATKEGDTARAAILLNHINANRFHYSMKIWASLDPSERRLLLHFMLGSSVHLVGDEVHGIVGNLLALSWNGTLPDWIDQQGNPIASAESITTLPTRGVFAEAHLGHCNAAEERDVTRLWNFDELPVSLLPNIEGLTPGPKGTAPSIAQPSLPQGILNIVGAPAEPDPTGMANALQLLRTPEIFRNMSGLAQVSTLLGQLIESAQAPSLNPESASEKAAKVKQIQQLGQAKAAVDSALQGGGGVLAGSAARPSAMQTFDNLTVGRQVASKADELGWDGNTRSLVTRDIVSGGGSSSPLGMLTDMVMGALPSEEGGAAAVIRAFPGLDPAITEPASRTCCAIFPGGVAGFGMTQYLDPFGLGEHSYGSSGIFPRDTVGQVYTARGGFVDLGHVRDLADTARYLASRAFAWRLPARENGRIVEERVALRSEGGTRTLILIKMVDGCVECASLVGARAAYDLAIWHEIVTWFTNVRYSSFSPEDNFSNLLGSLLGATATATRGKNYNEAMTALLDDWLETLQAQPGSTARSAIEQLNGLWFVDDDLAPALLGGGNQTGLLMRRHVRPLPTVTPWLVTDLNGQTFTYSDPVAGVHQTTIAFELGNTAPVPFVLRLPETGPQGEVITDHYTIEIDVDTRVVPVSVLPAGRTRIRSADLPSIVDQVRALIVAQNPRGDQSSAP